MSGSRRCFDHHPAAGATDPQATLRRVAQEVSRSKGSAVQHTAGHTIEECYFAKMATLELVNEVRVASGSLSPQLGSIRFRLPPARTMHPHGAYRYVW